jgi:predicted MPP superfamily phosphohydrolase
MKKKIAILLIILGLPIYAFFIEPKRLVVSQEHLSFNQNGSDVKVVQLSDIHLKKDYSIKSLKRIVEKTNQLQPDIIVFTGDLFDNYATFGSEIQVEAKQLLAQLKAPLGKYAVWGNHDYGGGAARVYPEILAEADFQLLKNTGTLLQLPNERSLFIAGVDDSLLGAPEAATIFAERPAETPTILLSHEPDFADTLLKNQIRLILSGHSHGGQVKLPFYTIRPPMAKKYYAGMYHLNSETSLYVNTGLGTTGISARFCVPPTITLFTLTV